MSAGYVLVQTMEWKRDWGLTGRIVLTGFLLLILYLIFMTILLILFPSASIWLFIILAVGMVFVQYFFSDKTGTLVNESTNP